MATEAELRAVFPDASDDFIARNLRGARKATKPERTFRAASLAARKNEKNHPGKYLVRLTSVREKLLDEDNLCPKYHIDGLRYAGLIPDDNPRQVKIEVTQREAEGGEAERVVIEIYRVTNE